MDKIKHFFTGHNWTKWAIKGTNSIGYYDQELWWERRCSCGAVQQAEFNDDVTGENNDS